MSQSEATARHKLKNPADESARKERQRHKDSVTRFHIRRYALYDIALPKSIDQLGEAFKRAMQAYTAQCLEPVEIEGE